MSLRTRLLAALMLLAVSSCAGARHAPSADSEALARVVACTLSRRISACLNRTMLRDEWQPTRWLSDSHPAAPAQHR